MFCEIVVQARVRPRDMALFLLIDVSFGPRTGRLGRKRVRLRDTVYFGGIMELSFIHPEVRGRLGGNVKKRALSYHSPGGPTTT